MSEHSPGLQLTITIAIACFPDSCCAIFLGNRGHNLMTVGATMDSAEYSDNSAIGTASTDGSPPLVHESQRLATVGSTSYSPVHPAENLRVSEHGAGFFTKGFNVFSTILSYFLRFCNGGYRPYIKQAEKDIDRVADFVEEGARLVVKLADEIEAMAHVAELTAQEAEDLALKVEAKTQKVKQTLDAIADVLEGDKKLSTMLTDYATLKKEAAQVS